VTIGVVIPAYNAEAYLAEAIASVLSQTLPPDEVIVVDDGSIDDTAAIADSFGHFVRVESQPNAGPAAAMNTGVAACRAEYLAFLSADDRWAPTKLARQHSVLAADQCDLVFGHVQHFLSPEVDPTLAATRRCPAEAMPANSAGTLLLRTTTFDRVGNFDERFRAGEFFDWFARANDLGLRSEILPDVVSYRRVHAANHSWTSNAPTEYTRVLKTVIERRRAATRADQATGDTTDRS
jgi:glycosyltransferase involved in cell wall biosynthesis